MIVDLKIHYVLSLLKIKKKKIDSINLYSCKDYQMIWNKIVRWVVVSVNQICFGLDKNAKIKVWILLLKLKK